MDRNARKIRCVAPDVSSLSARRAWIEIFLRVVSLNYKEVSLSARRAWIEIRCACRSGRVLVVALRKESGDRNMWSTCITIPLLGRSPQGERG